MMEEEMYLKCVGGCCLSPYCLLKRPLSSSLSLPPPCSSYLFCTLTPRPQHHGDGRSPRLILEDDFGESSTEIPSREGTPGEGSILPLNLQSYPESLFIISLIYDY